MEDSLYYTCRAIQASSDVLWDDKFTCHIPGHDEQNLKGYDQ